MPSGRWPAAPGPTRLPRPGGAPSPATLFAALPAGFQASAVDFTVAPFRRLTYAYPGRPPARLDLNVLPEPMRQELLHWLHTLAEAGERVNSWVLGEWVRVAAVVAAEGGVRSFTGLGVDEWVAAARRRYHARNDRLPPASYLRNHRAAIARLHAALALAYQAGRPWWRSQVWDPRHDWRIPVRAHEPLEGQRLHFARVQPAWLREAIQWYFAVGLETGLLSWTSLPGYLTYLGRHFGGFLASEGIDTPALVADPDTELRAVALRFLGYLRQWRTRSGRPLALSTVGLVQTTVSGFYAFLADRRAEAAQELGDPRWAELSDAHARWWRSGEIARRGRAQADGGDYIDSATLSRIVEHVDIIGMPRDQTKTVAVDGAQQEIRGLGDTQAMRAFLLAVATGRRINEVLMMDFAPLSPIPGLDTTGASQQGPTGPAARLRYQQTKIPGAPATILVGADVAAVINEQQDFARAHVRAHDPAAADPPYLFLAWQANTAGRRHYRASTLNGLLTQLAAALQITDATGAVVDFQRTHRMRHTKATDLLNAGVPLHVVQRYMGHVSPEMTMHYAKTLAETHEAEFLRFAKLGRDARPLEVDPADVYELIQLDRHTDRILPNGVCLLPPPKRCDRGNACLTCDHFATDARHLDELRAQLADTETLVARRQTQHQQRTGVPMGPDHVWLTERSRELASLRAIIASLAAQPCPGALRGAGTSARTGRPVPVTITAKPKDHQHER
jgi:integrase